MGCIWRDRANLAEYCAGCSNHTRIGCIAHEEPKIRAAVRKTTQCYYRYGDLRNPEAEL